MALLAGVLICVLMAVLVALRPLAALLLYGMTATYADGFGLSQWLGDVPFYELTMNVLFVVLLVRAVFRIFVNTDPSLLAARARVVGMLVVVFWCLLSTFVSGATLVGSFSILPYVMLPYVVVWIAFANASTSSKYLVGLVVLQGSLAIAVLLVPGLAFLRGSTYVMFSSQAIGEGVLQVALPTATTLKGVVGDHYAQFHNPNVLGFYGVTTIAVGLYMLAKVGSGWRVGGFVAVLAGLFMWVNSLTRGPMLGLLAMLAVWWLLSGHSRRGQSRDRAALSVVAGCLGLIGAGVFAASTRVLDFLIPSSDDVSVTARLSGFSEAWKLIKENPAFGLDAMYQWDPLLRPHFIGLLFGAEYGLIAGVSITWMVFILAGSITVKYVRDQGVAAADSLLVATSFGIMAGIAATNNFAGPILFGAILGHLFVSGGARMVTHARLAVDSDTTVPFSSYGSSRSTRYPLESRSRTARYT